MLRTIGRELREHAPFTLFGAATGVIIMAIVIHARIPAHASENTFWVLHPLHVLLSAVTTAGMFRRHSKRSLLLTIVVGYVGSVGIATLSDSIIPYLGEALLKLPNRSEHIGFIEKWWLVNPLALAGIAIGYLKPATKISHAGHILVSTWASLFHIVMALGASPTGLAAVLPPVFLFLFLAVWIPCCTGDIVFPLLFCKEGAPHHSGEGHRH